jgi:hypothetical protein
MATDDFDAMAKEAGLTHVPAAPVAPPAAPVDDFDAMAKAAPRATTDALHAALYRASLTDPTVEAKRQNAARALNVDKGSIVDVNRAQTDATLQQNNADTITANSPKTGAWLTDQANADVGWKDANVLGSIEKAVGMLASYPARALANPSDAWDDIKSLGSSALSGIAIGQKNLTKFGENTLGYLTPASQRQAVTAGLNADIQRLTLTGDAPLGNQVAQALGNTAVMLGEMVTTGPASIPAKAGEVSAKISTILANTFGNTSKAAWLPIADSATNTYSDVYAKTGDAGLASKEATKEMLSTLLTLSMPIGSQGSVLTRGLTGIPTGVALTEAQRAAHNLTSEDQQPWSPTADVVGGLTNAFLSVGMGHNPHDYSEYQNAVQDHAALTSKIEQAQQGHESMMDISALAQASELRKNSPEAFNQFVAKMTEDGTSEVYVPAKKLAESLDQAGWSDAVLNQKMPDVARQLPEALGTNGDVKISIADYATHLAGDPAEKSIINDLKTSPDGLTYAQMLDEKSKQQQTMSETADRIIQSASKDEASSADNKLVENTILQKIKETSMYRNDVSSTYAKIATAAYVNEAAKEGMKASELFALKPFDVQSVLGGDRSYNQQTPKGLNSEDIGRALTDKLQDFSKAVAEYNTRPDALGGKIINTDVARELSPHYLKDRSLSAAVHGPASQFVKDLYAAKLQEAPKEGELPTVLFTAGGTGAGKTSALLKAMPEAVGGAQIVYDTNMSTYDSSKAKVEQALDAGKTVDIILTVRHAVDALVNGALPRAMKQERNFGTGRTVPIEAHASTHIGSADTVQRIAEDYKDDPRVKVTVLDNSFGKGNAKEISVADANKYAYNDKQDLEETLLSALKGEYEKGNISEAVAKGFAHTSRGNEADRIIPREAGADATGGVEQAGRGTYGQDQRGTYNPETATIGLTRRADLSTFIHELGHHFLELKNFLASREGASEATRKDLDTLLEKFGVNGDTPEARLNSWNNSDFENKRAVHEQFAEGLEKYFLEGEAPSVELRGVFSRVRAWMMDVYKDLAPADIAPEVRQVFDRMFASEEAIKRAEDLQGYKKLFDTKPDGVDEATWKAYAEQGDQATQDAIGTMQARSMRDMKWLSNAKSKALRALQREANTQRRDAEAEITAEVDTRPAQLAKKALKAAGKGTDEDLIAEQFGYQNGADMHKAIEAEGSRKDMIEGMTDQRMLEQHSELSDKNSIARAADVAIHNEARAKFMATGLKILTKSAVPVREINAAAKEAANTAISSKVIEDLRPAQYAAAEARANKEALKLAPKDPSGAVEQQRAALLNNRLSRAAMDATDDINKGRQYLLRFDKRDVLLKMDPEVRDQILSTIDRFDLRKNPTMQPSAEKVALKTWATAMAEGGYSPALSDAVLNEGRPQSYQKLTVEEFRGVVDSIRSMEKIGQQLKTITVNGKREDVDAVVKTKFLPKLLARGSKYTPEEILIKPSDRFDSKAKVTFEKMKSWFHSLLVEMKPEEYKRNQYDMHELFGPFGRYVYDRMFNATYTKMSRQKALSKFFEAEGERLGKDWQESMHDKIDNKYLQDPDLGNKMMDLTRKQLIGIALHVGNESNFSKLTKGWNWEPANVSKLLHEHMAEKDWSAVQTIWDKFDADYPEIQAMTDRLGNIQPNKIEPRPFNTQFGEMKGGYAPIKYDPLRSKLGNKQGQVIASGQTEGLFGPNYFRNDVTTNGSLNNRLASYTDRVDLDYTNIAKTMQESIHDLSYREAIIDVHKIIEHPDFRNQFQLTYGPEAYTGMRQWLGNAANSAAQERGAQAFSKAMSYTRTGVVINGIGFRVMTILKHSSAAGLKTTGYFVGSEKYLAAAVRDMATSPIKQAQDGIAKFPELAARWMQQDRDYKELSQSMFEPESFMDKAHRFGHAGVAATDFMTAVPTAWAAYNRGITEGLPVNKGGTGKPMSEQEAVNYANKVVREAHGTQIETARSLIMNERNEAVKMMTTLYGFMNNTYGQTANMFDELKTQGYSKPEALGKGFMAVMVPAFMTAYLIEGNPMNDKHGPLWWMAKAAADEVAGILPGIRDAWKMVQGYRGAGFVGIESALSSLVKPINDAVKVAQERDVHTGIRDTADAIGTFTHIPGFGQAGASIQYLRNVQTGYEQPRDAWDFAEGFVKGHGDKQQ